MERERQNTTQVPSLGGLLLLGEVSYHMIAALVVFTEYEKKEWFHIVVEILVIQEEFCDVAQVLTVGWVFVAVYFKD